MFHFLRLPSSGASLAIGYITTGVLTVVWSIVWLAYLYNTPEGPGGYYYIIGGLIASGLSLLTIGILVGKIGRQGQQADAAVPAVAGPIDANAAEGNRAQAAPMMAMPQQAAPAVNVAPQAVPVAAPAAPMHTR